MNAPDDIDLLFERGLQELRSLLGLLDDEQAALQARDVLTVTRLSRQKTDALETLGRLQARLRQQRLPARLPIHDFELLLTRCQQKNRANGIQMNLQLAQGQQQSTPLGFAAAGYDARGLSALRQGTRTLGSV